MRGLHGSLEAFFGHSTKTTTNLLLSTTYLFFVFSLWIIFRDGIINLA
jgi:hypothetical protein